MPRKQAFSGKQKKKQLQERRERKKGALSYTPDNLNETIRDANFLLFSDFSVIFIFCCYTPVFLIFFIFSCFTFVFLNFLSLFVLIFCETACTHRFSVIFAKVQWHPWTILNVE